MGPDLWGTGKTLPDDDSSDEIPLLMLTPGGEDKFIIRRHFPGPFFLGWANLSTWNEIIVREFPHSG